MTNTPKIYIVKTARTFWRDDVTTEIVTTDYEQAMKVAITCRNYIEPEKCVPISEWEEHANSEYMGEITDFEIWENGKNVFNKTMTVGRYPFEQKAVSKMIDIITS